MWSSDESDEDNAVRGDAYDDLVRGSEQRLAEDGERGTIAPPTKQARDSVPLSQTGASELAPPPDVDWMKDWIEARVWQFFSDIEGFHLGDLDLTGRSPSRYEKLKRKWDAYMDDFGHLAPYVCEAEVDRPHFDVAAQEWVDEVYTAKVVSNEEVWDAFCVKWKLSPPMPYEDLAALTEHARRIVTDNPQPKFQKASLADMSPEIIHAIFSHLAGQYKDGHNLAATSKFFHEIGFNYVFEFRNIVLGADDLYHAIDGESMEDADAEVRAKMTVDRGTLLDHVTFLASRPDICRRIRRLRVANNWGNAALVGTADMSLVQLDDSAMFDPVLRALGELLPRVSLTGLDLEFLPFDKVLILAICAQENLTELNLKGCSLPWNALLFCRGETATSRPVPGPRPRSNIQYLSLTDLPVSPSFIWDFVGLCPHLRSLQATAGPPHGFLLPGISFLRWPPSATSSLVRLELYCIEATESIAALSSWLEFTAGHGHASKLNHLKLIFSSSIPNEDIELLLRALHRSAAPLRTLLLDGIELCEERPGLLDLIAQLFPNLDGLALARRAAEDHDSQPCVWPCPTSAYAAPLRAFRRLRCFGANFDISGAGPAPNLPGVPDSVDDVLDEESSAGEDSEDNCLPEDAEDSDVDPDLLTQELAAPFAAACPSLKYFVISGPRSLPQYCCEISRTATGVMSLEDTVPCAPEDTPEVVQLFNPFGLLRFD